MAQAGHVMRRVRTPGFLAVALCCSFCVMRIGFIRAAAPQGLFQGGYSEKQPPSWRLLTQENFTSVLKENEFSLCIATVPWSGESRSLMKDIIRLVEEDPRSFPGLHLFFVHINRDRLLGKVILGGSTSPTITLFSYGTAYKYSGRRSAYSIMASIRQGIVILRSDSVLLRIESPLELESFADSTDKAVILFDFCGWEFKVRQKQQRVDTTDDTETVKSEGKNDESQMPGHGDKKNETPGAETGSESSERRGVFTSSDQASESPDGKQSVDKQIKIESPFHNSGYNGHASRFDASLDRNQMPSVQTSDLERTVADTIDDLGDCTNQDPLYCIAGNTFQDLDDATSFYKRSSTEKNPTEILKDMGARDSKFEKQTSQDQAVCSSNEFEIFKAVYQNLSKLAADSVLTPHRIRFAIVTNEEVISEVDISTHSRPWHLVYLVHDFDRLPYSFSGVGDVEDFLYDHSTPLVFELEGEGYNSASSALLNDTPSMILFIDRMSSSREIQEKSKAALDTLQALSYRYASLADDGGEHGMQRKKSKGKEKQISEVEEKISPGYIAEQTIAQMLESQGLLTLLEKSTLETGRFQKQTDGHVVFELLAGQHLSSSWKGDRDASFGNQDVLLTNLAELKLVDEKVKKSLVSGADQSQLAHHPAETSGHYHDNKQSHRHIFLDKRPLDVEGLPGHVSSHKIQSSSYSAETPGLHSHNCMFLDEQLLEAEGVADDKVPMGSSSTGSLLTKDEQCRQSVLKDISNPTTDAHVPSQSSVPTQRNLESDDFPGSDNRNCVFDVKGEVYHNNMMEMSFVSKEEDLASSSVKLSDTVGSMSTGNVESSQPPIVDTVSSQGGKPGILHGEAEVKLTDEEDLPQFIVDEDDGSDTYWNGMNFYFIDGEDQLKEKLTRSKTTPALVIIDPEKQAHYIVPSNLVLHVTALSSFVNSILSGEPKRAVLSEPQSLPPRQPPRPPFVNRDFHEIFAVPRVTVDSFSKLVTGFPETDEKQNQFTFHTPGQKENEETGGNLTESALEKDVMVLFTTPWCGFCKRMELVVREVYRSFQLVKTHEIPSCGVTNNFDDQQNLDDPMSTNPAGCAGDHCMGEKAAQNRRVDIVCSEPPMLLQMDCTLNDCSDYLKEIFESVVMAQEETYPAVVLFPSKNKLSPVIYRGAATVRGIYEFLKAHGSATNPAQKQEGDAEKPVSCREMVGHGTEHASCHAAPSSTSIKIGSDPQRGSQHKSAAFLWELSPRHMEFDRHADVGSMLLASEKLFGASPPFENSVVLIVNSSPPDMVHGLILNKPLGWKTVQGLDGKVEELLKDAALGYGGPVVETDRPFLVLTRKQILEEFTEVVPGVYYAFVASKGSLLEMIHTGRLAAKDFWFFLGYSSWTWHQLQGELMGELWQVRPFSDDLVKWPIQWSR